MNVVEQTMILKTIQGSLEVGCCNNYFREIQPKTIVTADSLAKFKPVISRTYYFSSFAVTNCSATNFFPQLKKTFERYLNIFQCVSALSTLKIQSTFTFSTSKVV